MKQYLNDLKYILDNGAVRDDRTNTGTISVFGMQSRYNLNEGFPAVTTKRLAFKAMASELLWFLEGSSDERRLAEILHGTRDPDKKTIWTANSTADYWKDKAQYSGDLGRVYGSQWRRYPRPEARFGKLEYVDQIAELVDGLKNDPYSRRHILNAWNPGELDKMALPPCHILSQYYVHDGKLSSQMYQRSADYLLGSPFNIASYSLLTHMLAQVCDLGVGEFIYTVGDAHIYMNHIDAVNEQLSREPMELCKLWLNPDIKDINDFKMDDIKLIDYKSHPSIKAPMAV